MYKKSGGFAAVGILTLVIVVVSLGFLSTSFDRFQGDVRTQADETIKKTVTFTLSGQPYIEPSRTQTLIGMKFGGEMIPKGAVINSAKLEGIPNITGLNLQFFAERNGTPANFSSTSKPSTRVITSAQSTKLDTFGPLVSEIVVNSSTSSIAIIAKLGGQLPTNISGMMTSLTPKLQIAYTFTVKATTNPAIPKPIASPKGIIDVITGFLGGKTPVPTPSNPGTGHGDVEGESMAMHAWRVGGKNAPNPKYDKCDDGTDVVTAHNQYYVIAYDGIKYPTWHPPVVTNPITNNGKCYFGHEHGSDPQGYRYWDEIVQHFGKDQNNDGVITKMIIAGDGKIIAGDRAGLPFGMANEKMDQYYNQENRDSIFVRHEDHVGHKVEWVNMESDMVGKTTHTMAQLSGTVGVNIPYGSSNNYQPTGVVCTHLHKFHQGTHSGDAIKNNLHEVVFHSNCMSVNVGGINAPSRYPSNTILLTGMMTFGDPGGYKRFCGNDRSLLVCPEGKNGDGSCKVSDPLLSKLPNSLYSDTLGRNMVDRSCLQNVEQITGSQYFNPYEIWQGDLRITTPSGKMLAEHGRQWDVLDPIRFIDPNSSTGFSYNSEQCNPGGLLYKRTLNCGALESKNQLWDSPQSGFRGLKRTTYFGRNRVSNSGGAQIWWTDPLGGNAVTSVFGSGLKQKFSSVEADICKLSVCSTLNDRAIQRQFSDGGGTVHAPN